ncbi:hypothetical protein ACFQI7_27135 [Paenibacillus allorhizosphaerae]|uniref:Uncharacterized protein n=1 Tax=Paenibacillus allorhizosphaerae TaxID=2849866 RepID=A0ABN7TNW3_9BACL|nr:hypothetical protein [Paenibacillus allorhizosphaerae]CAG7649007.1 hypothetical protein PAECIP111802_04376 [Paenibacillus allorhizosphaerae]
MKAIYPISAEKCRPFYGKPVCIFLKDGSEIFGTLSRVDGQKLILNEGPATAAAKAKASKTAVLSKKAASRKARPANESARTFGPGVFPGFRPFGGAIVLDLPIVARVFTFT